MDHEWTGKAVSIECNNKLGVFQGIISQCTPSEITIVRTFRNGVPTRNQCAEVTLRSSDIQKISLLPTNNSGPTATTPNVNKKVTPIIALWNDNVNSSGDIDNNGDSGIKVQKRREQHHKPNQNHLCLEKVDNLPKIISNLQVSTDQNKNFSEATSSNSINKFFGNLIPPKVEVKFGPGVTNIVSNSNDNINCGTHTNSTKLHSGNSSKPIDIIAGNYNGNLYEQQNFTKPNRNVNNNGNGSSSTNGSNNGSMNGYGTNRAKHRNNKQSRRDVVKYHKTFDTCVDDPLLNEDFDFEGNLALFDKQAIWNTLDESKKPDLVQQAVSIQQKKYRHDENILVSEPIQMRQIESLFEGSQDFITDEGLIIPTIPLFVRSKIELCAEKGGFSIQRQIDLLARGTTDLALLLLGGARRLIPKNRHQWPTIVIICEKTNNFRTSNVGAAIGRQLASLGLKVLLYLEENPAIEQKSIEVSLFKSTSNAIIYTVDALPTPDLVILSTNVTDISNPVRKWLNENRASILAVDPPPKGIKDVCIKYAILPILPLNDISPEQCGKLYLCNLTVPDKFFRDAGVKYKSPFGHKFVIPIHSMP